MLPGFAQRLKKDIYAKIRERNIGLNVKVNDPVDFQRRVAGRRR